MQKTSMCAQCRTPPRFHPEGSSTLQIHEIQVASSDVGRVERLRQQEEGTKEEWIPGGKAVATPHARQKNG